MKVRLHADASQRTYLAKKKMDIGKLEMSPVIDSDFSAKEFRSFGRSVNFVLCFLALTFQLALEQFRSSPYAGDVRFTVRYFPYQLYPDASKEGEDKYEWYGQILILLGTHCRDCSVLTQ